MRGLLIVALAVLVLGGVLVASTQASQYFTQLQYARAEAINDWSFMTAWNLSTGNLQASPDWYNGIYSWGWYHYLHHQWIARFVYDDGTGQTRELEWSYSQPHIQ